MLERLARRVEEAIRETDLLFRWGGEEFLVLMPHIAAGEVARVAERVRARVEEEPLVRPAAGPPLTVTVSVGAVAEARLPCESEALLRAADAACYQAKREGRNRVVVSP